MTLYQIDEAMQACLHMDPETGEVFFDEESMAALELERDAKVEGVALWIKDLTAEAKAIRDEENALAARRKTCERKAESLRQYLTNALQGAKFSTPKVAITWRKSQKVEVDESLLGEDYWAITYKPDLAKAKDDLKAGKEVAGARLVDNMNMQLK